ncbi:MAG: GNAT family N-acetyltransferase [Planctomycetota bacterium]|nr:GNAT family N-acetyltransferase [Planctomycetota bacterium]
MSDLKIRLATFDDLLVINDLYNYYVLHSTCTYQTEPSTPLERAEWFASHGGKHPVTAVEIDGQVVGWGALSRFHSRCAYANTVEDSVYVHHDLHRRGVGAALLADLVERARAIGHHTIIGLIDGSQAASIAVHSKLGFHPCAHLKEVGCKFDRWLDVIYMQLLL